MAKLLTTIAALRDYLNTYRSSPHDLLKQSGIALVPTMGALHIGHLSLIDRARIENTCVVLSIFVNPLQFGENEDLGKYPRTLDSDLQICQNAGVDVVFAPHALEMGVTNRSITQVIPPSGMISGLCARSRSGHFQGVATIVTKLFNIVQPSRAYFGNKDGQQLAVIRRLVQDLNLPVEIIGCPTVREPSGLAYSSRNQYLSKKDCQIAAHIYQSLQQAQQLFHKFNNLSLPSAKADCTPEKIIATAADYLANRPEINLEYIELVEANTLQACTEITAKAELMLAIAARIGNTRLIDNILLSHNITPRKPIIAIDGPAGAGKSTVTKQVANKLGLLSLDTGAMYRSITLAAMREDVDLNDYEKVKVIAARSKIQLIPRIEAERPIQILLNGEDVTSEIRLPDVTANVSTIAAQPAVRDILVKQQQQIGQAGGVVMEGRDIGTHVFPDAEIKIFLTASASERAKRRQADLIAQGQVAPDLDVLEHDIQERDRKDSTRDHAPLIQAEDATLVNTDGLTIEEVVAAIVDLYEAKVQNP